MISDSAYGVGSAEAIPLDEATWIALETGAARLLSGSGADADLLARLFASVVGEFRALHRDLALFTRAPASFRCQGQSIVRSMRVLERSLRAGQVVTAGAWRLGREDGRSDDDQPFSQYTVIHAVGGSAKRQTSLVLIRQPGQTASSFYPLPFDAAVLEESDVTGRSATLAIERDESDAVFIGCLTMLRDKPTGSPTDFGVLLRQDGTQEWSGGPLARQALQESARVAMQAKRVVELAPAPEVPAASAPPAAPMAREPVRRPARRSARAEAAQEVPTVPSAKCRKCGASLAEGARFCASCGEPAAKKAAPAPAQTTRTPVRCRKCGVALPPDVRFCSACGEPTAAPVQPTTCAQCGSPLRPDARYCASCGVAVGKPGAAQPARAPVCATCGAELRVGARFCRRCGSAQR